MAPALSLALLIELIGAQLGVQRYTTANGELSQAIYARTSQGSMLITNSTATAKLLSPIYGERLVTNLPNIRPSELARVLVAHPTTFVAVVEKNSSPFFQEDRARVEDFIQEARSYCTLTPVVTPTNPGSENALIILKVDHCRT
jgi:hypothetical protein